jgi:hypothetical protein
MSLKATMSLKAALDAFRSEIMAHVPPEVRDAIVRADMELAVSGITQRALKAGDRAPDFSLPDARGRYVRLNRNRLEPAEILTALQSLSKNCKGEHHANISR